MLLLYLIGKGRRYLIARYLLVSYSHYIKFILFDKICWLLAYFEFQLFIVFVYLKKNLVKKSCFHCGNVKCI